MALPRAPGPVCAAPQPQLQHQQGLDARVQLQPPSQSQPLKRLRSTSDFVRAQRSRQGQENFAAATPTIAVATSASSSAPEQLALVSTNEGARGEQEIQDLREAFQCGAPLSAEFLGGGGVDHDSIDQSPLRRSDASRYFEGAVTAAKERRLMPPPEKREKRPPVAALPSISSSEDMSNDLSMKTSMKLFTNHSSFRWLQRLPFAIRVQHPARALDTSKNAKESVMEIIRECLPSLKGDPEKALKWIDRIVACLSWYEVEGPPLPSSPLEASPSQEIRKAWRKVSDWDNAFRSLETLLRQGLLPMFTIVADRFSVTVLGDGAGTFLSGKGELKRPSQSCPCAVLCPSTRELRELLQENHVPFDVATTTFEQQQQEKKQQALSSDVPTAACDAMVSIEHAPQGTIASGAQFSTAEINSELRDLLKDGEKVVSPDEAGAMGAAVPTSTALWFEGSWRVHALLDVLRQHSLGAPLSGARTPAPKLPTLVAPAPFAHATACSSEVLRTQSAPAVASGNAGAPSGRQDSPAETRNVAELSGCFFPTQVRKLLELLRVLLPSFSCELVGEPRYNKGINIFTKLGNHYVSAVECERVSIGGADSHVWKWDFRLGSSA